MLQELLLPILQEHKPDCLVADMFFPWATDDATACDETLRNVKTDFTKLFGGACESELKSFGNVLNSFYELEKDCVDYNRNASARQARHVGPISFRNEDMEDEALRGKEACLTWLDSKEPNSVIYAQISPITVVSCLASGRVTGPPFCPVTEPESSKRPFKAPLLHEKQSTAAINGVQSSSGFMASSSLSLDYDNENESKVFSPPASWFDSAGSTNSLSFLEFPVASSFLSIAFSLPAITAGGLPLPRPLRKPPLFQVLCTCSFLIP
ncbi:hypothetical protein NL676_013883 [Syzygium grande]|nr:hypothetical protein NL676_013883 [Syzygium grande]